MKFFSKISNYRIYLKASIPGNPYMQIPPVAGVSVKFTDGIYEANEELTKKLKAHHLFGKEFFADKSDPFASGRIQSEPVHHLEEMEHGVPVRSTSSKGQASAASQKLQKLVEAAAKEMLASGGYVQVQDGAQDPVLEDQPAPYVPTQEEPMDSSLAESGEKEEELVSRRAIPDAIGAVTEVEADDGVNPLASTLPQEAQADLSEEKSNTEEVAKPVKARGKKTKK